MEPLDVNILVMADGYTLKAIVDALINARTNASGGEQIDYYQRALDVFVGSNYRILRQYGIVTNEMEEAEQKLKEAETGNRDG